MDIDPEWTQEVVDDGHVIELNPHPQSRVRATGYIGFSPSADRVLTIVAYRDVDGDIRDINAWQASGRDRATYRMAVAHDEAS